MALTTSSSGTTAQTAGGGEVDIVSISAVGRYWLKLDLDLMAAGDVIYISKYIIVKTGGASNLADITMFSGVDGTLPGGAKVIMLDPDVNDLAESDALQYTINQPFGTTRALPYAVIKEDNTVVIASGGIPSGAHVSAELNAIADAVLDRNMATGTDSGTDSTSVRTPRQALRALRNKVSDSAGTVTVTKENDSTTSWTAASTRSSSIGALTAVDPT